MDPSRDEQVRAQVRKVIDESDWPSPEKTLLLEWLERLGGSELERFAKMACGRQRDSRGQLSDLVLLAGRGLEEGEPAGCMVAFLLFAAFGFAVLIVGVLVGLLTGNWWLVDQVKQEPLFFYAACFFGQLVVVTAVFRFIFDRR